MDSEKSLFAGINPNDDGVLDEWLRGLRSAIEGAYQTGDGPNTNFHAQSFCATVWSDTIAAILRRSQNGEARACCWTQLPADERKRLAKKCGFGLQHFLRDLCIIFRQNIRAREKTAVQH